MSESDTRARKIIAAAEVSEAEMACRMIEAFSGMKRPVGATAESAMDALEPVDRAQWQRAARAAIEYLSQCLREAKSIQ